MKPILADLAVAHACILTLAFVTPSYLSPSIDVFYGLRMIQSALMGQYVFLHPKANSKLQALLRGVPLSRIFFCSSWEELSEALACFKHQEAVYLRFSHIANFQPKFYIGSTSSFVLDREHSRYRKFLQVQQNKFVLAEVALRFWCRYDNFWMWSVFPIYTNKPNFWALEQALIQLWQPRLNTPFIYQFFNCRKGIIQRTKFRDLASLEPFHFGANYAGNRLLHMFVELSIILFSDGESNFGKSSKTWVQTLLDDSTWKNAFVPTNLAHKDATSYDDLPTTLENHNAPTPSTPSTEPSPFGAPNESDDPYLFEHLGF